MLDQEQIPLSHGDRIVGNLLRKITITSDRFGSTVTPDFRLVRLSIQTQC
jgi:hypothetical protein